MNTTTARTPATNPSLLVISTITGSIVSRTTWASWALDNGECMSPTTLQQIADELRADGIAEVSNHYLVDITPKDAEVHAWLVETAARSGIPGLRLKIDSDTKFNSSLSCCATVDKPEQAYGFGTTLDAALAEMRASLKTPERVAAEKREAAAKLLAEAEALVTTPQHAAAVAA